MKRIPRPLSLLFVLGGTTTITGAFLTSTSAGITTVGLAVSWVAIQLERSKS